MDSGVWLFAGAVATAAASVLVAVLNRRSLGRIETSVADTHTSVNEAADSAKEAVEQVRTSNGRTLAQVVEDNTGEIAQLRGDMMELAIQLAKHTSDHHTHDLVRRQRQAQRDRQQLGQDARDLRSPPLHRDPVHYWDEDDEDYGRQ